MRDERGNEPMTDAQRAELEALSRQTGAEMPNDLTREAAAERIDRLRDAADTGATGIGVPGLRTEPEERDLDENPMRLDDMDHDEGDPPPMPPTLTR